jgi:predicted phage-related endonuclease
MTALNADKVSVAKQRANIDRIVELQGDIARLKAEFNSLVAAVKAAMGDAAVGTIGRTVVARWDITSRQQIDQKALKAEQPEIALKYTHTIPVRSFKIGNEL